MRRTGRAAVYTRLTLGHVMASSAIPLIFPAVKIGESFYGDGSVSQTAPLSPAVHLGARRILAVGMRALHTTRIVTPDAGLPARCPTHQSMEDCVRRFCLSCLRGWSRHLDLQPVSWQPFGCSDQISRGFAAGESLR